MHFEELVNLLSSLGSTSKRIEKVLYLRDFLTKNFKEDIGFILDLIVGNYHREIGKKNFNISLKTLFEVLAESYNVKRSRIERKFNEIGDIGKVTEEIFKEKEGLAKDELTLDFFKKQIEKISSMTGTRSSKIKKEMLMKLYLSAGCSKEALYLSRLIVNDLRVGVKEGIAKEAFANTIFAGIKDVNLFCGNCSYVNLGNETCFNCGEIIGGQTIVSQKFSVKEYKEEEDLFYSGFLTGGREVYNKKLEFVEKKYNLLNSFSLIISRFRDDKNSIFDQEIILGRPVKSMLGMKAESIEEAVSNVGAPLLADYKYDGLRLQVHKGSDFVRLFTRNLEEVTDKFPEAVEFFRENYKNEEFVLDAEGIGYDFDNLKFIPFQEFSRRFQSKNYDEVKHITLIVRGFDIIYYNGETLIEKPYEERRKLLEELVYNRDLKQKLYFDTNKL